MRINTVRYFPILFIIYLTFLGFPQAQAQEKIVDVFNGNDNSGQGPDISGDGRYVVYSTPSENFSPLSQIFLLDRSTNETILISQNSRGEEGDNTSRYPRISRDGSYVVFLSVADNLIDNDQHLSGNDSLSGQDLYGYDVATGEIELLSKSSLGVQGLGISERPNVSDDGRHVVFSSKATNLIPDDQNGIIPDAFVHDRVTGKTIIANRNAQDVQSRQGIGAVDISGDGTKVVFSNGSNGLIETVVPLTSAQIFLKDLNTGEVELISQNADGNPLTSGGAYTGSENPLISSTGDVVVYQTYSTELLGPSSDKENYFRLALFDRRTKQTTMVSANETTPSLGAVRGFDISADGRYLAFITAFTQFGYIDRNIPTGPLFFFYDTETRELAQPTGLGANYQRSVSITDDGSEAAYFAGYYTSPTSFRHTIFSFANSSVSAPRKISIEKTVNGELSIVNGTVPLAHLLAGRPYRADYTLTNTSDKRLYAIKVFDDDQGSNQLACNLYALDPDESTQCHRFYQAKSGGNIVSGRVIAKISGEDTAINASTPAVSYIGQDSLSGGLTVKHALNSKPGDDESSAILLAASTDQSWLFKVTNSSNIDVYKVKVYNDGVFPLNTGWEELCLIGKLKIGETRHCKRPMAAGQEGLNLMMGRAQGNDAYVVGSHQYINAANPTYYTIEP